MTGQFSGKVALVTGAVTAKMLAAEGAKVRGDGMAERAARQLEREKTAVDSYIRGVAGHSPAQEIEAAKRLLDAGILTEEEFDALKQRALA
tara:strand:+ start:6819 stop:7091 length:273 start_codon:yes stop_codon:yes gene_type:complete